MKTVLYFKRRKKQEDPSQFAQKSYKGTKLKVKLEKNVPAWFLHFNSTGRKKGGEG